MAKINWQRPQFRLQGRERESADATANDAAARWLANNRHKQKRDERRRHFAKERRRLAVRS
jgi:hypothetical protein